MNYRHLSNREIEILQGQACIAQNWENVLVCDPFNAQYVRSAVFSGEVRLGVFEKSFTMPGGVLKHSGLSHVTLHNVTVGDNCCIENVKNYIANYEIGEQCYIENVDIILQDAESSYGNGVQVSVLNESGGREVPIYDNLSSHQAYFMALYRHRPDYIQKQFSLVDEYVKSVTSSIGTIGSFSKIVDAGYLRDVKIGEWCSIEGTSRLRNGSVNGNRQAPVTLGVGVIAEDFIVSSGSTIKDNVILTRCFVGQACTLGNGYTASDSLFFSNCQGYNGEACSLFAGPFTVTHHKSTLLIAGMFSFMNAGSGSNQSNHMYKLGPIHQGIMERGAKTASDSYILWPSKVGAFSLVMGRHVCHQDTSDLPFSYLIEEQSTTYIVPGANLKSVGTIRDARKWPLRDERKDACKLDCINYNLLSPYTIQKMMNAISILKQLQQTSGLSSERYSYQSGVIRKSALQSGLKYYSLAIDKFLGNSLVSRIMKSKFTDVESFLDALKPDFQTGLGDWVDISGLIAPKSEILRLIEDVERGNIADVEAQNQRFLQMHSNYYDYEWTWAYDAILRYYGINLSTASFEDIKNLISRWISSVVELDNILYDDARKEFSLSAMTSFGADGDVVQKRQDFQQVRGSFFEDDPFVRSIKEHIVEKTNLFNTVSSRIASLK